MIEAQVKAKAKHYALAVWHAIVNGEDVYRWASSQKQFEMLLYKEYARKKKRCNITLVELHKVVR